MHGPEITMSSQAQPVTPHRSPRTASRTTLQPVLQVMVEHASPETLYPTAPKVRFRPLMSVKRAIDIVGSLTLLVLLFPILVLIALAILCEGRPVFFRGARVGRGGRIFNVLKFRTMVGGAESLLEQHLASNPAASDEWHRSWKLRRDPRVTRLGQILRISSADELPQLVNVLLGDMSLVGPRPVTPNELHQHYGADEYFYLQFRPGITGLWQISGRNECSYAERVSLDVKYVQNWSLRRDVLILLRTFPAVVSGRGAY